MELAIFQKKGNLRRKRKQQFSSEKMLAATFAASLAVHLLALYTIPDVQLFSEGMGSTAGEIIEVDFIAEELPETGTEVVSPEENQFAASQPLPEATAPPPEPVDAADEPEIAAPPEIEMPSESFTLLAQSLEVEPELALERTRPTPAMPVSRPAEMTRPEKMPAQQVAEPPELEERPTPVKAAVQPEHSQEDKPVAEERLQFPAGLPTLQTEAAATLPERTLDQPAGFARKQVARPVSEEAPSAMERQIQGVSSSKRRLVGLDTDSSQDANRFGIFAGEKRELSPMKDAVQEAAITPESQQPAMTDETEEAKPLDINTQIEGPLRGRAIVYKPAPPQLTTDIENEVELRLKFWVLPDGTIGDVIPLKRGDAKLERIAIAYLRQWQFEPLQPDIPQERIWGTIPIVFTTE